MNGDWRADRIGSALRGENPTVMARLPGGFAVIGDVQWLPGYCVLLADDPAVTRLSDLPRARRLEFLDNLRTNPRIGCAGVTGAGLVVMTPVHPPRRPGASRISAAVDNPAPERGCGHQLARRTPDPGGGFVAC